VTEPPLPSSSVPPGPILPGAVPPGSVPYTREYVDLPVPPNARGESYRLALHLYPDPGPDAPVVVIFPAMGTPARFYRPFAQRLGADGIGVVVVDLRGTGESRPTASRADRYGYVDLIGDVATVLEALRPRLAGRRYYLLGHSLGGQLSTVHLARMAAAGGGARTAADGSGARTAANGSDARTAANGSGARTAAASDGVGGPAGLLLVAVGLPYYRVYPRGGRLGLLAFSQSIVAISAVCGVWPGWALGGKQSSRVMLDWGYTVRHGHFPDHVATRADLALVRTPVLAISVARDYYTPHATLDLLCALLPAAPVTRVRLDDPLDHFSWVRQPEAVAAHVVAYVRGPA
jgi:predicted alpha/beta hydrolase